MTLTREAPLRERRRRVFAGKEAVSVRLTNAAFQSNSRSMSTLLINYADGSFHEAQKLNLKTGLLIDGFDRAIP